MTLNPHPGPNWDKYVMGKISLRDVPRAEIDAIGLEPHDTWQVCALCGRWFPVRLFLHFCGDLTNADS